jgi:SAM-dependent methyltransferase
MQGLAAEEYIRERIDPRPGDPDYLHLSDLLLGLKTLMPRDITRILDYGCGGSPYRPLFGACTYHRADLAGDLAVDFEYGPDSRLPAELADYDCVLSSQVLEHVLSPAVYLAEAYRVLQPGGHLLLSTHGLFEDHACPYDYWRWTAYGLRQMVEETGFKVDRILKLTTGPRAAIFLAERELSRLRFRGPGFYARMLNYGARAVRRLANAKRRHLRCNASFPDHRMADEGDPGHDMYIAVIVQAHR